MVMRVATRWNIYIYICIYTRTYVFTEAALFWNMHNLERVHTVDIKNISDSIDRFPITELTPLQIVFTFFRWKLTALQITFFAV